MSSETVTQCLVDAETCLTTKANWMTKNVLLTNHSVENCVPRQIPHSASLVI